MIFLSLLIARESNTLQVKTYGPRLSTFLAEVVILFRQMMGMNDAFEKLMPLAGNLINLLYASYIMADTLRMQQPAADLDSSVVSPITVWMAPVAKKCRQTNNCNNGGTGLLRCVLVAMSGMICKIKKNCSWLKMVLSKNFVFG